MDQYITFLKESLGIIIALSTVLGLFLGKEYLKQARDKIMAKFRKIFGSSRIDALEKTCEDTNEKLDQILLKLQPNGGGSIVDSLNRIERKQQIQGTKMGYYLDVKEVAMFETDANGLCVWVSKTYENLMGRTFEEVRDWGWVLTVHEDDADRVVREWKEAVEQKRIFEMQYRVRHKGGFVSDQYCRAVPTLFNGEVIAWVGALSPNPRNL